jgi:hypothetical protein
MKRKKSKRSTGNLGIVPPDAAHRAKVFCDRAAQLSDHELGDLLATEEGQATWSEYATYFNGDMRVRIARIMASTFRSAELPPFSVLECRTPDDVLNLARGALAKTPDQERWRLAMPDIIPVQLKSAIDRCREGRCTWDEARADAKRWIAIALAVGCSEADAKRWVDLFIGWADALVEAE